MKNERLARAMTQIDYALIEEAEEMPKRKTISPERLNKIARYGGMAACMLLVVGALLLGTIRSPELLLYGEEITSEARLINEYMPRSVAYWASPADSMSQTIPLELEFKRSTTLTVSGGEMVVLDENGEVVYSGTEYLAKGNVSLCIALPDGSEGCTVVTDRGYKIVLNMDAKSGLWYVNIEK